MYQTLEFQGPSLSEKKFKNSAVPDSNVIFFNRIYCISY